MNAFKALLGLSFKSMLLTSFSTSRSRKSGKRKKAVSGIGALALLCVLMLYLSGFYSFSLGYAFASMGGLDLILAMMVMMAAVFPLIFIVFAAQSQVFSTKDIDLVMSLPVSGFSVMMARVLAMYLEALLMVELLLLPAGAAYLYYGGVGGVPFMLGLIVFGLFLALLPTCLALVFGSLVALIVARARRFQSILTVLVSLVLMVGVIALSFGSSFTLASDSIDIAGLRASLYGAVPPLGWVVQGLLGNVLLLAAICVGILVPFVLIVWLFSRFYKSLLTHLSSHHLRSDYKLGSVKASGSFAALWKKESGKFFGTPALLLNSGLMLLLMVVASVAAVIFKDKLDELIMSMVRVGAGEITEYIAPILLAMVCLFGTIVYFSCVSISLEGKTLWILKEAPVSTGQVFTAKAGFNFAIAGLTMLISVPLLGYAFSVPVAQVLLSLLVGLLFAFFTSVLGLLVNLYLPRMDAENETIVIKQSASVLVMTLADFLFVGAGVGLYFLMRPLGFEIFALVMAVLFAALSALVIVLLNTKGRKLYAAL